MDLKKALEEIKKQKKRNFDQAIDLIVNLKKFNPKKENVNIIVKIPHKIKDKKICGFLNTKSEIVNTITKNDFVKYKNIKDVKRLAQKYDFFIALSSLMPSVATTFGRVLGPAKKMPSPQLGILPNEDEKIISNIISKINSTIRIVTRDEACIKTAIGKQSMKEEDIIDNIKIIYKEIINALPIKRENVKNIIIKSTMGKPIKVEVK